MQLSTNLSFNEYLDQMMTVLNQVDTSRLNQDQIGFDKLLELLVFKLGTFSYSWDDGSQNSLSLQFDGTVDGLCDLIIDLVKAVLLIIYDNIPVISGDLDKHIMDILLYQFTIRLMYKKFGKQPHPALGTVKVSNVVATIRQKPVKLYEVLQQSYEVFMVTRFPEVIMVKEKLDDEN